MLATMPIAEAFLWIITAPLSFGIACIIFFVSSWFYLRLMKRVKLKIGITIGVAFAVTAVRWLTKFVWGVICGLFQGDLLKYMDIVIYYKIKDLVPIAVEYLISFGCLFTAATLLIYFHKPDETVQNI